MGNPIKADATVHFINKDNANRYMQSTASYVENASTYSAVLAEGTYDCYVEIKDAVYSFSSKANEETTNIYMTLYDANGQKIVTSDKQGYLEYGLAKDTLYYLEMKH